MGTTLKVGVIGCGAIAQYLHVPDMYVCGQAEIVAFCDLIPAKARALADQYGTNAKIYRDYRDLLRDKTVEAVVIALPNVLHGPVAIAAAKAGKHAVVEKPMATSMAEARKMVETAKRAGTLLMVNQSQRLFQAHRKAKEVIDSGILGKILHVTAMFGHSGPEHWSPTGKWFFKKKEARFGAMADLGVHKADLIRFLTGKEVAEISAFHERLEKKNSDVEDNFVSCLKFTDGTLGTLSASWTVKGASAEYTVLHCANGTLRVNMIPDKPVVANLINPECEIVFDVAGPANDYPGTWGIDAGGAYVRAMLGLQEPYCTGEEGMKSLEIILAAEQASLTGRRVRLGR